MPMIETITTEFIMKFCAEKDHFCAEKYGIAMPFAIGDFLYATDTCILLRLDRSIYGNSFVEIEPKERRPNVHETINPAWSVIEWNKLPAFAPCERCLSTGVLVRKCNSCHAGICRCDCCNKDHVCGWCDGTTLVRRGCRDCRVFIGNRWVDRKYANLIAEIPEVEWGVSSSDPDMPLYFRADGMLGVLMPLSQSAMSVSEDDV